MTLNSFFKRTIFNFNKETALKQRSSGQRYALTIIRYTPEPTSVTGTFDTGTAAVTWLGVPTDSDCLVEASVWRDNVSLGDFCLWCSEAYAVARIGEHRDHNASNLNGPIPINNVISFKDDDGSLYTPSSELVLPREAGIRAIHTWLIDLEHPGFLHWS
ncbi:hypothetical protein [Janthinobacterium sp. JC611]|uniref:hypothetical protein n=1 Tax=Janthinobacterium sp. JC611 TaxID=2816201 RepID=UPI001BFDF2E1|nr:hypothetical protein [Janthinobacterium sp. JC611]